MLKILNLARLLVLDGMSIPLNLKFPSQGFSILKFYFCGDKCHFWILQRIELEMDLRGLTCKKLKYFCVKLTADDPLPPFTLAKAVNGANIGCSRTKCKYYQMLDTVRGTTLSLPPHTPSPPPPPIHLLKDQHICNGGAHYVPHFGTILWRSFGRDNLILARSFYRDKFSLLLFFDNFSVPIASEEDLVWNPVFGFLLFVKYLFIFLGNNLRRPVWNYWCIIHESPFVCVGNGPFLILSHLHTIYVGYNVHNIRAPSSIMKY